MLIPISMLLAFSGAAHAVAPGTENFGEDLERIMAEERLQGIAWVLVENGDEIRTGAAGLRDGETSLPFDHDTQFHVGSVTKTLLATGVLRLVSEGEIELDAPAERYLAGLSFKNPWSDSSPVTVRHLLDHTSGLDDARLWQLFSERPLPQTPLFDAFPDPERLLRIRSRPGSRFSYSNMGYALLGVVIETVSGAPYEDYLDQALLAPLDMTDSTFGFTTQIGEKANPNLAWGHVDDGSRVAAAPVFLRPAAQFTTTARDLGRFARFLMGDGTLEGRVFIDADLMRARGRPRGTEAAGAGLEAGYALGLGRRDRNDVVGYCHGGNIVGFVARLCVFPDSGKAYAYSVNTDSETADYGRIDELFVSALSPARAPRPPFVAMPAENQEWRGFYVPSPNRFSSFEYLDTVFGAIWLVQATEGFRLSGLQARPRLLQPVGGRLLSAADRATSSHVLLRGANDELLISDGFNTFRRVPFAYVAAHWLSAGAGIAGMFWLLAAGAVVTLRNPASLARHVISPAVAALVLLVLTLPLFFFQSFMALGDVTVASAGLASATMLLPVGMLVTLALVLRGPQRKSLSLAHGMAAFCVLQWCLVLAIHGMLPFRLWV